MRRFYYDESGTFTVSYPDSAMLAMDDNYVLMPDNFNFNTHRFNIETGEVEPNGAIIKLRPATRMR